MACGCTKAAKWKMSQSRRGAKVQRRVSRYRTKGALQKKMAKAKKRGRYRGYRRKS